MDRCRAEIAEAERLLVAEACRSALMEHEQHHKDIAKQVSS